MKVLSKRQISLINHLTQESGWLATSRAAKILNISVSTLRRDVEAINLYFTDKGHSVLSKPGLGLKLEARRCSPPPYLRGCAGCKHT